MAWDHIRFSGFQGQWPRYIPVLFADTLNPIKENRNLYKTSQNLSAQTESHNYIELNNSDLADFI